MNSASKITQEEQLDIDRTHSMAEEGGRFAAEIEAEPEIVTGAAWRLGFFSAPQAALIGGLAFLAGVGGVLLYRAYRERATPSLQPV